MKKLFLFLYMTIISYSLVDAQFFDNNTIWSEAKSKYYFLDINDTVINTNSYFKIFKYDDDTSFHYSDGYDYTFVREDNNRVYWYDPIHDIDLLLYDFSLTQGDSIYVTPKSIYTSITDSVLLVCEYKDTITDLLGNERLRLKMKTIDPSLYYSFDFEYWIYGIGSSLGLFNSGRLSEAVMDQQDPLLYCCHKNMDIVYHDSNQSDCHQSTLNTNNLQINTIEIYPNPAFNKIDVKSNNLIDLIYIVDYQGRIVINKDVKDLHGIIDLKFLENGIYTLIVSFKDGSDLLNKIVKL